jgi:hypothetical protein
MLPHGTLSEQKDHTALDERTELGMVIVLVNPLRLAIHVGLPDPLRLAMHVGLPPLWLAMHVGLPEPLWLAVLFGRGLANPLQRLAGPFRLATSLSHLTRSNSQPDFRSEKVFDEYDNCKRISLHTSPPSRPPSGSALHILLQFSLVKDHLVKWNRIIVCVMVTSSTNLDPKSMSSRSQVSPPWM